MSIFYIHNSVPNSVASLIAPKSRRYAEILMELEGHDPRICSYGLIGADGLGLCDIVSDTVAAAWKKEARLLLSLKENIIMHIREDTIISGYVSEIELAIHLT